MLVVKVIIDTSNKTCFCNSWFDHWVKFNFKDIYSNECSQVGCDRFTMIIAHVRKIDCNDDNIYIVPLCDHHNLKDCIIDIGDTPLAFADISKTCGKK